MRAIAAMRDGDPSEMKPNCSLVRAAQVLDLPVLSAEEQAVRQVDARVVELSAQVDGLRDELERARQRIAQLERLADRDSLTPLLNRRAFMRELSRIAAFVERYRTAGSLLYFDVNGMKQINDRFGHGAGDAALVHVATVMANLVRETDVVGRLGGDEFGVILDQAGALAAVEKAEILAQAIHATPVRFGGRRLTVCVAYGIHGLEPGQDMATALHAADRAMYAYRMRPLQSAAIG